MSSKKKAEPEGRSKKLARWLGAPVRALSRACDSYVRRMSACAGRMPTHAGAYGGGRGGFAPGSVQAAVFSSRSSLRRRGGGGGAEEEDVDELVRAMSLRQAAAAATTTTATVPARSRSVAAVVGRIDEDAPCEFGADDVVRVGRPPVRRARSVAVGGAGGDFGAFAARSGYKPRPGAVRG